MAKAFSMDFDASAFDADLEAITVAAEECMRPAAQAGIQVFYDEVLLRVPVNEKTRTLKSGRVIPPGALKRSIYQVYSEDNSDKARATYHCSWNARKAPHGHLVENGTSRAAAHPFIRPAFDAVGDRAVRVVDAHITFAMQPVLGNQG